jgi:hypothetical protein
MASTNGNERPRGMGRANRRRQAVTAAVRATSASATSVGWTPRSASTAGGEPGRGLYASAAEPGQMRAAGGPHRVAGGDGTCSSTAPDNKEEVGRNQERNEVHPSNPHSRALVAKCSP